MMIFSKSYNLRVMRFYFCEFLYGKCIRISVIDIKWQKTYDKSIKGDDSMKLLLQSVYPYFGSAAAYYKPIVAYLDLHSNSIAQGEGGVWEVHSLGPMSIND